MKLAELDNPIRSSWLADQGFRLAASPYLSGSYEAKKLLERLPGTQFLHELTAGHDGGIYNGPKFRRNYVSDPQYGVPFLGSTDIMEADFTNLPLLQENDARSGKLAYLEVKPGMTLISCSGTVGRMCYVRPDMDGFWSSQDVLKVVANESKILAGYLHAFLSSRFGVPIVTSQAYGSMIPHLEPVHIMGLPVPRFSRAVEEEIHKCIQGAADRRAQFQAGVTAATRDLFESAGLPELIDFRWDCEPRDTGFSVSRLTATTLRAMNMAPRVGRILERLASIPHRTLGDICADGQLSRGNRFTRIDSDPEYGYRLIGQRQGPWLRPEGRWVAVKQAELNEIKAKDESVLVASQGTLGENEVFCRSIFVTGHWQRDYVFSEHFLRIASGDPEFPGAYLFAFLRSEVAFRIFRSMSTGSKQQDIHEELRERIPVPACTEADRERIAETVRQAYRWRDEADQLEDRAQELLDAAVRDAAHADLRLDDDLTHASRRRADGYAMAEIISGGEPVNDSERAVIRYLRDHSPAHWVVLHNFELRLRDNRKYEIDVLVITEYAITLIDVKGTRGRIEVAGGRWYPSSRQSFRSPVEKLRTHARALKGNLAPQGLSRIFVDSLVVLTASDARLIDGSTGPDADALNVVTGLDDLIPELSKPERVRPGLLRDIARYRDQIIRAFTGIAGPRTGPLRFGHWAVIESLGETEEVTEYRARNANAPAASSVLLRVYHADPFQPEDVRAADRIALTNAYNMLVRLPSHDCVVGCLDFFGNEDESHFILVLEDVRASALFLHLTDPQLALTADGKMRIIRDMLRGLAHAHANHVLHRVLSPTTVLVTQTGGGMLTGFDYARPENPRSPTQSVLDRLADVLDPVYVAPECQNQFQRMSKASDVYAAGVIAFQVLTGELPFATSMDQYHRASVLPAGPMAAVGLAEPLTSLLRLMCAKDPADRPSAARALEMLAGATMTSLPLPEQRAGYQNLPEGYQLTRKYTVQRRIGGGSFATVYQVYDSLADADRAVKIVDRDGVSLVARLQQEYQILLPLPPHPNIVKVESADFLEGQEVPYLAFEYLDGKPVSDMVKDRSLGPAETIRLGVQVATGLAFLHNNGVYHCDIKPSNLVWTDGGCKIIDFNVAVHSSSSMSRAGGSARYAPPDASAASPPTADDLADRDVYALGVTLYEVLTGRYPFSARRPVPGETAADPRSFSALSELSDEVADTLLRAIAPLRGDRFGSAAEFLAALDSIGAVHRRTEPSQVLSPVPAPPVPNVNPFVDHLQSLYSQSLVSNAGTRGEDKYGTYVSTALDDNLIPDVLDGMYRLVIITGNAGDGKTTFLERLVAAAADRGGQREDPRPNGTDIRLPDGRLLRTNNDGSQDEGDRANDEVLTEFFGPFADGAAPGVGEMRLIAINEGRLIDFLTAGGGHFATMRRIVESGLAGEPPTSDIAVVNLNQRSLVASDGASAPVFDRVLAELTHERFWAACESCDLAQTCYAPHNARTFAHPSAGPKITRRLRDLHRLVHLRGQLHITLRDLRSALAFMLTSGRDCAGIHELYRAGARQEILSSFYFNSWTGTPGAADRLLRLLGELDVATEPQPALDGKLATIGPAADHAMMTVDLRGGYDMEVLGFLFDQYRHGEHEVPGEVGPGARYLKAARRRFYFECIDDARARSALPFRSAERFLSWLSHPDELAERLPEIVEAINRGEGLPAPALADGGLALATRDVPGGTIRSYRVFAGKSLALTVGAAVGNRYIEGEADSLELTAKGPGGHAARLRIRLDLFELLQHQRDGYLPNAAELQGRYLELEIFKNELSATPYQQVVLTRGGQDAHLVRREADGRLIMTPQGNAGAASGKDGTDGAS